MDYQKILIQLYEDFNKRSIDAILAHLDASVNWPNGWEGGHVHGHEEVRAYWLRQWQEIDPNVKPISFQVTSDQKISVAVHQLIKNLDGAVLSDSLITHTYTFDDQKVRSMQIE